MVESGQIWQQQQSHSMNFEFHLRSKIQSHNTTCFVILDSFGSNFRRTSLLAKSSKRKQYFFNKKRGRKLFIEYKELEEVFFLSYENFSNWDGTNVYVLIYKLLCHFYCERMRNLRLWWHSFLIMYLEKI